MQRLPTRIVNGAQLTATAATYYTVPSNTLTTISACSVTNTTVTAQKLTLYLVPADGTAGPSNCVCFGRVLAAGETYNVGGAIGQTLGAGGTVQALSDAAAALSLVASAYATNP